MIEDFDPKIGKQSNIEIPFVTPVNCKRMSTFNYFKILHNLLKYFEHIG